MTSFDTVIVGGGPIGMAIASCLGQHGMAVALIEKRNRLSISAFTHLAHPKKPNYTAKDHVSG